MKKRCLSLLLALVMCLSLLPATAFAADSDFVIEDGVLTKYNGSGGDVVIPNTVTEIASWAFEDCESLTSVVIPSSVTELGRYAFYNCPNLTTAIYPFDCFCVVTTESTQVRYTAFQKCPNMNAFLTKDDTILVQYIGKKDDGVVTIPEGITGIEGYSREYLVDKNNPYSEVAYGYRGIFQDDEELTGVILPNSLTYIGVQAFADCPNLSEITIPFGVTELKDGAFAGSGLTHVTIPENVTTIGSSAFRNCASLTDVALPSGAAIGSTAFYGSGLTSLTVPAGVTSIGTGAFHNCNALSEVTFSATTSQVGNQVFWECKNLERVTFTSGVPCIADSMFSRCESLTSVTIPSSVTSIGGTAFYACTGLTSVTIPNGVTSIGDSAFWDCTNLTSVTIPNSVTSIGSDAFQNCGKLTQVAFSATISAAEKEAAFGDTPWYKSLDETVFKSENGVLVRYDGPGGNVVIPSSITAIGNDAFSNQLNFNETRITSVVIPSSVTKIGDRAFYYRSNLTSVTIMPGVKTIGASAFFGCPLTEVVIPEGVTTIGGGAFVMDGPCMLKSVYTPASVTSMGEIAFQWDQIGAIYYGGSEADWYAIKWDTYNGKPGNAVYGEKPSNMHYNSPALAAPAEPTVGGFTDVPANTWYSTAVAWAVQKGITNGTTATTFSPDQNCTHGQILTFLWRAAGKPVSNAQAPIALNGDEYYAGAVRWAAEKGMIGAGFDLNAPCTRADAVLYIWQAFNKGAASYNGQFTDVPANSPYATAVAWALAKGVTTGTSATTFSPNDICSRGHIVTFLHRAYSK